MCEICNGYSNCPVCGDEKETCEVCGGEGYVHSDDEVDEDGYEVVIDCPKCEGNGFIY